MNEITNSDKAKIRKVTIPIIEKMVSTITDIFGKHTVEVSERLDRLNENIKVLDKIEAEINVKYPDKQKVEVINQKEVKFPKVQKVDVKFPDIQEVKVQFPELTKVKDSDLSDLMNLLIKIILNRDDKEDKKQKAGIYPKVEIANWEHSVGSMISGNSEILYGANNLYEESDTITYIGSESNTGIWQIMKMDTSSGLELRFATVINNPSYTSYGVAWDNKNSLAYTTYSNAV